MLQELIETLNPRLAFGQPLLCKLLAEASKGRRNGPKGETERLHQVDVPHDQNLVLVRVENTAPGLFAHPT